MLVIGAALGCASCATLDPSSDGERWRESQCRAKYGAPCAELDRQRIEYDLRDVVETGA
jgi:disulfide oxidoreductase YuzD